MPAGRPTKYDPKIIPQMLDLFDQGKSIAQVCKRLNIAKDTFYNWKKEHKEFSDAIKEGEFRSMAWWEDQGQDGLWVNTAEGASKLNFSGWFMQVTNRFRDHYKHKHDDKPEEEKQIPKIQVEVITKKDGQDN